ncbi:hypothetical protein BKA69DRAFT_1056664 [Paraphysoderma sedebokerense]|nr:hypothetical protein BKA69DRAFT_1056664 [Paraphysoderma sedebokerense]
MLCGGTILVGMIFTASSYYSIYRKSVKDGFKWKLGSSPHNIIFFSSVSVASCNQDLSICIDINTAVLSELKDDTAIKKQMIITQKLALITLLFFIGWAPMGFNIYYQTFSGSRLSPIADFICGVFALSNSIFNSLVILTMDSRWKLPIFRRLKSSHSLGSLCQRNDVQDV